MSSSLRERKKTSKVQLEPQQTIAEDSTAKKAAKGKCSCALWKSALVPLAFTIVAFYLRAFHIDANKHIIWDEAHFAKFGAFYLRHEFYHDVHPPLGKMLCGLSEYISGFNNTEFMFESGKQWPEETNLWTIRIFQAFFSSGMVPAAYYTCRDLGLPWASTLFVTAMVTFECSFIVLGKFVLLDSFLMFFMATTFWGLARIHRLRNKEFTTEWIVAMVFTGISIGCVCSVKWVGLFITVLVGLYTVLELYLKFWSPKFNAVTYAKSWAWRIATLILIPAFIYVICFKIHYAILWKPGTGSGSMSTLFQVNQKGTDFPQQSRYVDVGTALTIRSQGASPNLLHSHSQVYPDGSRQHQVTTYGFKDSNNIWKIQPARGGFKCGDRLVDGDIIRLQHKNTGANLHSHAIPGHVTNDYWEVSGYGSDTVGDVKDDWVVEIVDQAHSSNATYASIFEQDELFDKSVHPVSTTFRLRHDVMGCYLATTGAAYPAWGFKQGEVICKPAAERGTFWAKYDHSTWWNIENLESEPPFEVDPAYKYPKSNFFSDFLMTNQAMAASNNGLVPDEDKFDGIASAWWEWPILRRGLRMSSWSDSLHRYYMFMSPFGAWFTTLCLGFFVIIIARMVVLWQRQALVLDEQTSWYVLMAGISPFLGYVFHYLPFIIMGRVTYFHHYMPALYFAIFTASFVVEYMTHNYGCKSKAVVYGVLFVLMAWFFYLFQPNCLGMVGPVRNYMYMNWFPRWEMARYHKFSPKLIWEHLVSDSKWALESVKSIAAKKAVAEA